MYNKMMIALVSVDRLKILILGKTSLHLECSNNSVVFTQKDTLKICYGSFPLLIENMWMEMEVNLNGTEAVPLKIASF